jgi:hypothetical protein
MEASAVSYKAHIRDPAGTKVSGLSPGGNRANRYGQPYCNYLSALSGAETGCQSEDGEELFSSARTRVRFVIQHDEGTSPSSGVSSRLKMFLKSAPVWCRVAQVRHCRSFLGPCSEPPTWSSFGYPRIDSQQNWSPGGLARHDDWNRGARL